MSAAEPSPDAPRENDTSSSVIRILEWLSFGLLLLILAWAPFPLGSNRPWSWSLLALLVSASWLSWWAAGVFRPAPVRHLVAKLIPPLFMAGLALAWGVAQISPVLPQVWVHPIWPMAADALGIKVQGALSMAPWQTGSELMKLGAYAMVAWLAYVWASRTGWAGYLLNWLILVGACYMVYGFALLLSSETQFAIFYGVDASSEVRSLAGPFVNHNSYATYAGLIGLCAGVKLIAGGWSEIAPIPDARRFVLAVPQYMFGHGAPWLIASLLALSSVIATGSRGGNVAAIAAMLALLVLSLTLANRQALGRSAAALAGLAIAAFALLFAINDTFLSARFDDMAASGLRDDTRHLLWDVAERMIGDAPLQGLGLGTYQIAYPHYAQVSLHFVIDKAHNDYLELAAGWGLPAAILWWVALVWLVGLCLRGIFVRRRYRIYPMLAVGAAVLVGVHSMFDFSLQIPAIAVTFAAILGLGVAQAFPVREQAQWEPGGETAATGVMMVSRWSIRLLLLGPPLAIMAMAVPRLVSGAALEGAFPADLQITANVPLSLSSYAQAADILSSVDPEDGDAQILRAEAAIDAGWPQSPLTPVVETALSHSPGSARGWIVLAALLSGTDPKIAARDLTLAFRLAPIDYYLILPRTFVGAGLWDNLPGDIRTRLLADTHRLALDNNARRDLRTLLSKHGGPELVARAFAGQPEVLRALNRDLARESLHL